MKWENYEVDYLKNNYKNGLEYCSNFLNRTKKSVAHKLKKLDLINNKNWTEYELKILKENYSQHGSEYVSKIINRTTRSILWKAFELNIEVDNIYKCKRISETKRNSHKNFSDFKVNPEQFLNINTKEISYILGFLWADGYLFKDAINMWLKREDCEDIKNIFDKTGLWNNYYRYKNSKFRKEQMCFQTNNRFIFDFLVENKYKEKSLVSPNEILSLIPEELKNYFFRGYFDGDGSIGKYEKYKSVYMSFTSTYDQDWSFIEKLFNNLDIKFKSKISKYVTNQGNLTKTSRVVIQNKKDIIKFCNYIYGNSYDNYGLKRKYKIYEKIKNI